MTLFELNAIHSDLWDQFQHAEMVADFDFADQCLDILDEVIAQINEIEFWN